MPDEPRDWEQLRAAAFDAVNEILDDTPLTERVTNAILTLFAGDALASAGYALVPVARLEQLEETASAARGRFPRCEVIKPDRDKDFYVGWSHVVEAPVICGTRAEMIAEDCPESRLRRADDTGTSYHPGAPGCTWDANGLVAEQRGYLPRRNLAAYTLAIMEDRKNDAWDLLEPFEGEDEVRRD